MSQLAIGQWLKIGAALVVAVPLGVLAGMTLFSDGQALGTREPEPEGVWEEAVQAGADAWTWTEAQAVDTADWVGDGDTWTGALDAGADAWTWTAENSAAAWDASVEASADAYDWTAESADAAWTWTGETLDEAGTMVEELFE